MACKTDAMGKTEAPQRCSRFKYGGMSIDDKPSSRCLPATRTYESVKNIREMRSKIVEGRLRKPWSCQE
ncbi:hypothetical protein TNCV_2174571 [Trichonephila clavipes]|nr:hypothetical protein TNCV_2174571 [Trichonephila clavipes]